MEHFCFGKQCFRDGIAKLNVFEAQETGVFHPAAREAAVVVAVVGRGTGHIVAGTLAAPAVLGGGQAVAPHTAQVFATPAELVVNADTGHALEQDIEVKALPASIDTETVKEIRDGLAQIRAVLHVNLSVGCAAELLAILARPVVVLKDHVSRHGLVLAGSHVHEGRIGLALVLVDAQCLVAVEIANGEAHGRAVVAAGKLIHAGCQGYQPVANGSQVAKYFKGKPLAKSGSVAGFQFNAPVVDLTQVYRNAAKTRSKVDGQVVQEILGVTVVVRCQQVQFAEQRHIKARIHAFVDFPTQASVYQAGNSGSFQCSLPRSDGVPGSLYHAGHKREVATHLVVAQLAPTGTQFQVGDERHFILEELLVGDAPGCRHRRKQFGAVLGGKIRRHIIACRKGDQIFVAEVVAGSPEISEISPLE